MPIERKQPQWRRRSSRSETNHPGESIAILVRNRAHLTHLLPGLNARAIPWTGADIHALAEQPVIDDLMTLLKAMSSSTDRIAWLALLRTPFVGMSLRDIEMLAQFDEIDCRVDTRRDAR